LELLDFRVALVVNSNRQATVDRSHNITAHGIFGSRPETGVAPQFSLSIETALFRQITVRSVGLRRVRQAIRSIRSQVEIPVIIRRLWFCQRVAADEAGDVPCRTEKETPVHCSDGANVFYDLAN